MRKLRVINIKKEHTSSSICVEYGFERRRMKSDCLIGRVERGEDGKYVPNLISLLKGKSTKSEKKGLLHRKEN